MEAEILAVRDFPTADNSKAGKMETHVFVRLATGDVVPINLGKLVTNPDQIKSAVVDALKLRQSIQGHKVVF